MSPLNSWKEAIVAALDNSATPLHYREIWEAVKSGSLYETKGATPENTINYIINKSIKEEGDTTPFVFHGGGLYSLKRDMSKRNKEEDRSVFAGPDNFKNLIRPGDEIDHLPSDKETIAFGIDNILADGCFLSRSELERILLRLIDKKNLILQGPPGTGKTWLARRLAKALIGHDAQETQLRSVQFHPNLSYEDVVRGWRPTGSVQGSGTLTLHDGVFLQMVSAALAAPAQRHVLVIEEINRGNPAQIFGELLTLLEAGKRTPRDAMQLCYPDADGVHRPVHVPENLFVIGTMNTADRSLALVDLAFRRRFAFIDLEPSLGEPWRTYVVDKRQMDPGAAREIEQRLERLNATISSDSRLGQAFCIGHSYVTPHQSLEGRSSRDWFAEVVASELKPLLQEYWFDAPERAAREAERLLEGW